MQGTKGKVISNLEIQERIQLIRKDPCALKYPPVRPIQHTFYNRDPFLTIFPVTSLKLRPHLR